ncbi:hypothetical protein M1E17_03600 [Arthrobacter sp. D1-29]
MEDFKGRHKESLRRPWKSGGGDIELGQAVSWNCPDNGPAKGNQGPGISHEAA